MFSMYHYIHIEYYSWTFFIDCPTIMKEETPFLCVIFEWYPACVKVWHFLVLLNRLACNDYTLTNTNYDFDYSLAF